MYRQILLFRRIVNSTILWLWFWQKESKKNNNKRKVRKQSFTIVWRIPNSFRSRKRKSSEMNKSCARCNKVVYPIEELKCLDKVCQFFLLALFSFSLLPFQSCWLDVFYWIFPFRLATKSWLHHTINANTPDLHNSHHYVDCTKQIYIYHALLSGNNSNWFAQ